LAGVGGGTSKIHGKKYLEDKIKIHFASLALV
jgi:hypothetical protein